MLLEPSLDLGTGDGRIGLAGSHEKGENLSTEFDWVPMPSVAQAHFSLVLHPLEQPIDRHPMHRDRTLTSGFSGRDPFCDLPDDLTLGRLTLLGGHN